MIITPTKAPGKPNKPIPYRPSLQEGQYIRYRLNISGKKLAGISLSLGLHPTCTHKVISGKRHSSRIESEIARILGKADWNEVVLEARSEVQKKPVNVILQEMEQEAQARKRAARECMADYAEANYERATKIIREGLAEKERKKQERKLMRAARRRALA